MNCYIHRHFLYVEYFLAFFYATPKKNVWMLNFLAFVLTIISYLLCTDGLVGASYKHRVFNTSHTHTSQQKHVSMFDVCYRNLQVESSVLCDVKFLYQEDTVKVKNK